MTILEFIVRYVIKKIDECDPVLLRVQMQNILRLIAALPSYQISDAIEAILTDEEPAPEQEAEDA